jgi:predicted nucleotide-binding protein (sugar kinase/HSP70/actin superfamily)
LKNITTEMINIKPKHIDNIDEREWLLPYMGDISYAAAATLRTFDIRSGVMPTNTPRGYELAQKHIQEEVCHPLRIVTGDVLSILEQKTKDHGKEYVEDNFLIVLPTSAGPCRFGKYQEALRMFMDKEGFQNVPVGGPSDTTDYADILNSNHSCKDRINLQKILLKGVTAADLLDDMTLRTRPYAHNKQEVNQLKKRKLRQLERIIENGAVTEQMVEWGQGCVDAFRQHISTSERFPLVIYAGEIYIRQHDPATGNVIERLEDNGLEVVRTPAMEWFEYVNRINRIDTKTEIRRGVRHLNLRRVCRETLKLGVQTIKGEYVHRIRERITEPFKEILQGRHALPEPLEIIRTLEANNEYHSHIRGESALSIGIAYWIMNDKIPRDRHQIMGMFHVGPFTCMQEGVATAKIKQIAKRLRQENPNLICPIVHAYFGDSPNPNLNAEIAVFREQCYQKRFLESQLA